MDEAAAAKAAQAFINEVWGLQGTAYAFVILRYFARLSTGGLRGLDWDDLIMFIAVVVHTAESVMGYLVVAYWKGFANNGMTDAQRAALDPNSEEFMLRVNGSKTHVVGLLLYTTLLWLLKGCWIVYYARLTDGVHKMRRMIRISIWLIPATYVGCLLVAFLKCIPFHHQWQINPSPGNQCMPAVSAIQTIFVMVMNTITDFFLMAIPLPVVWKSQLSWGKKFTLLILFSGGFLEMAFGILRAVSIITLGDIDPAQSGYWSIRESFVSVILTNMPMVYPLIKRFVDTGRQLTSNRTGSATANTTGHGPASHAGNPGYRLGSYPKGSRAEGSGHRSRSNTLGDTSWDSQEQIVPAKSGESSDEVSIELPRQMNEKRRAGPAARGHGAGRDSGQNQIVITTEFTVREGEDDGKGGKKSGYGGF